MIRKRAGIRTGRILFRQTLPRSDSLHRRPSAGGSLDGGSPGPEGPHRVLSPSARTHTCTDAHAQRQHTNTCTRTQAHVHPQTASLWGRDEPWRSRGGHRELAPDGGP